ncbi:MAG TPA: universal stress protein [Gaiellaceae bacterium]|nr:universal stress protein [Gaiellaceae bacterium]
MARKLPGLTRALGGAPLASVAFGEIGSSLYFALGIVALYALGFTPWVLLIAGAIFLLVSLSYAEGTAAIPEPGGAALFVRRAFNDPAGFVTGWALFLDYLIVIALAALFVPHYLAAALGWEALRDSPWDVVVGVCVVLGLAVVRLVRRPQMYAAAVVVAGIAALAFGVLIVLGLPLSFSPDALTQGVDLGNEPEWREIAFALPLAMLAYTGLETVANLASEAREPGRTLPRSLFAGIGAVVVVSFLIALVGISEFPVRNGETALGGRWRLAPLAGIAQEIGAHLPAFAGDILRVGIALSGVLVLLAAVTTSMSGASRLTYSLARHGMLPHAFERLNRRTLLSPAAILTTAGIASLLLVISDVAGRPSISLASLYSFGVLLAFTAAQLAVWRLRRTEPGLPRPFRAPGMPATALVGASLTAAVWVLAIATHGAARIVGPLWVVGGLLLFVAVRRSRGEALLEHVQPAEADIVPSVEGQYRQILVPVKLGPIGDEVMATAIRLAEEVGAVITALHVIPVPMHQPIDAALFDAEERAESSLAEAKLLASEHGVDVEGVIVRARAIGAAVVAEAVTRDADLIVMGSSAKWRRQSRFFSPTVDYVLRKAPCEVMVIVYPQGVLEEEGEAASAEARLSA